MRLPNWMQNVQSSICGTIIIIIMAQIDICGIVIAMVVANAPFLKFWYENDYDKVIGGREDFFGEPIQNYVNSHFNLGLSPRPWGTPWLSHIRLE